MRTLREIYDAMSDESDELQAEGVSFVDYWLARMDIDRSDWRRWQTEVLAVVASDEQWDELSPTTQARIFISHGFFTGLLFAREMGDNELKFD